MEFGAVGWHRARKSGRRYPTVILEDWTTKRAQNRDWMASRKK